MNSLNFTRTHIKNRKPVNYGTNKMGKYYSNQRVPIKNYNTTPIAARIDKNMTNLRVPENLTNKNLTSFIDPILDRVFKLQPELKINIFNYHYDSIHIETGLAEKMKIFEKYYEEIKLISNKNIDIFNYKYDSMNIEIDLAKKIKKFEEDYEDMKLTLNKDKDTNVFNYKCSSININMDVGIEEKLQKIEDMKLTQNKENDINVFNYKCSSINMDVNVGIEEKLQKMEDMKLTLSKETIDDSVFNYKCSNINIHIGLTESPLNLEANHLTLGNDGNLDVNTDVNVFNYKCSNINMNVGLTENPLKFEDMKLSLNKDLKIFNHDYDNININAGLAEKTKKFEEDYEEIKQALNKVTNANMNLKTVDKNFNSFVTILDESDKIKEAIDYEQIMSILNTLHLTNITIENVYQEKYNYNVNATGIGDFIRGSYFLMQFCKEYNFLYNINMLNHPISRFIEIYQNKQPSNYKNIYKFEDVNFNPKILNDNILTNIYDKAVNNSFIHFLNNQTINNKKIHTYIISYPNLIIEKEHKKYMQHLLKPTKYMSSLVDLQLKNLELSEKRFTIIHVRYGDNYLIKNETDINLNHLNNIKQTIDYLGLTNKILLISDNIFIKKILATKYPHIKTHFNKITHTGEGVQLETNKLKNTMIDFYLFSRAKNIYAFSVYNHGTGFSKWAAETYSVPYICRFLQ